MLPKSSLNSPCSSLQVIQAVFFGLCVLIDVSSLLTKGGDSREQERQLRKLIGLRDWMMAVLAFPVGAVRGLMHIGKHVHRQTHNSSGMDGLALQELKAGVIHF